MNMIEAVKVCFSKYVTFSGRARRAEYWWFTLFLVIISVVLVGIDIAVMGANYTFGIADLWSLVTILPSLAVTSRRLHDTDRSAWWMLLFLIPLIGAIILIVWLATKGTAGSNRFGEDPLRGDRAQVFN